MARSFKKTPICGHTKAETDKQFKELSNRKFRRKVKSAIYNDYFSDFDNNITYPRKSKDVENQFNSDKDGKQYLPKSFLEKNKRYKVLGKWDC